MHQPSTELAQVPETPALPSTRVSRYAQHAKAENTRKAYRVDWDDFLLWCDLHDCQPMPATPETVVEYLESLADAGAKVATIKRRLASISVAHQMRGYEHNNPTRSGVVTTSMQGIRRPLGTAQTQKAPLVTAELARLVAVCGQQSPLMAASAAPSSSPSTSPISSRPRTASSSPCAGARPTRRPSAPWSPSPTAPIRTPARCARSAPGWPCRGSPRARSGARSTATATWEPAGCTPTRSPASSSAPARSPDWIPPATPATPCAPAWLPQPLLAAIAHRLAVPVLVAGEPVEAAEHPARQSCPI